MKTKILSIVLAIALIFSVTQVVAFADEKVEINVYFVASSDSIIVEPEILTVYDGIAEDYGYTVSSVDHNSVPVNDVTVLDVLVAAHVEYYGSEFTSETATDYLSVSGGYLQKAFGASAFASGFTVNNKVPHDDIEQAYGYTGYASDTACVEDGDFVSFFFYQDSKTYLDVLGNFGTVEATLTPSESITYTLTGYCAAYYGCSKDEVIEEKTETLTDVDVFMKPFGSDEAFVSVGTTDENGEITLSFEETGDYVIYATGETESESPIIYTWNIIHVVDDAPDAPTLFDKLASFFDISFTFIIRAIKIVFKYITDIINLF